jgi:putative phosphoesterase
MRVGLIADIHADVRALEATLRHLDRIKVNLTFCAGDVVGYGDQADAAVALLKDRAIPCVRGNHDRWALERRQVIGARGWKPAVFTDDTWAFLEALPTSLEKEVGSRTLAVHHGSPVSDTEFVSPYKPLPACLDTFWAESPARVLVLGHTHIPMVERGPAGTIFNPGSVLGVPGVQTSYSFAVVEWDDLSVRFFEVRTGRETRRDPIFLNGE